MGSTGTYRSFDKIYVIDKENLLIRIPFTEADAKKDSASGENLLNLAISEINNENNFFNQFGRYENASISRIAVLKKIEELEKAGKAFKNVNRIAKNIAREKEFIQSEAKRDTEINFSSGKDITDQAEARFNEIYGKLEEFASKAGKLKSKFHKNSEEYKKMITSLKEALESGKDIKDKLGQKQNVEMNSFKDFAKLVVDLGISSQNYISAKNLSQRTDLGKDRYSLATDMRNLAQENFAIKEMPVKKDWIRNFRPFRTILHVFFLIWSSVQAAPEDWFLWSDSLTKTMLLRSVVEDAWISVTWSIKPWICCLENPVRAPLPLPRRSVTGSVRSWWMNTRTPTRFRMLFSLH